MALVIRPTKPSPERLLLMGAGGSGKTNAWMEWLAAMPDATAWVVDTDNAVERMLEDDRFAHLADRIELCQILDGADFPLYKEFAQKAVKKMAAGDLFVVDLADKPWDQAQEYYTGRVFSEDLEEYFLTARIAMEKSGKKGGSAFDGNRDWGVINKLYFGFANNFLRVSQAGGHVVLCTPEEKLREDADRDTQRLYGDVGFKPKGQKQLGHMVHTVIRVVGNQARQRWVMTTVKDRSREAMDGVDLKKFPRDYLVNVAGWERVPKKGRSDDDES